MTTEVVTTELMAIIGVGAVLLGVMLTSLRGLRSEMQALRTELRSEMQAHREETQGNLKAMQKELRTQQKTTAKILERVAHVEGLLKGLREALFGRRVPPAERETAAGRVTTAEREAAVGAVAEDPEQYKG